MELCPALIKIPKDSQEYSNVFLDNFARFVCKMSNLNSKAMFVKRNTWRHCVQFFITFFRILSQLLDANCESICFVL